MLASVKWIIGIVIGLVVLVIIVPVALMASFPTSGYGMMGFGRFPMMGGFGFMPFGMLFIGLIGLGLLILIILGIAALIKYLTTKSG